MGAVEWKIYLNHTLSSWGDRMWDFAVGLYLVILYPQSLMVTAALGLCLCLSVILLGSWIGKWIDATERLKVVQLGIFIQNAFVVLGAILIALNIYYRTEIQAEMEPYVQILLFVGIIAAAVVANLASTVSDIAVEKDWVVVLCEGDEGKLASLNSTLRTIDLTTHVLAPLAIGQILTYGSQLAGVVFIALWNIFSALAELILIRMIYQQVPLLGGKVVIFPTTTSDHSGTFLDRVSEGLSGWRKYFTHPVRFAGIAFSLLFMTVMGFDSVTLGYIYNQGGNGSLVGIITGVGAVFGVLGSLTYPFLRDNLGKLATGNIGFSLNILFLVFSVASVFGPGSPFQVESILQPLAPSDPAFIQGTKSISLLWEENINIFYFIIGIVLARYGLWVADLSVTQIIQEGVEESSRGIFNGVQTSLDQLMNLVKFILVILYPSQQAFGYLILTSWAFLVLAWVFFLAYTTKERAFKGAEKDSDELQPLLEKS